MDINQTVRQGDVLITRIADTPDVAGLQKRQETVLAYGEVTGHMHRVVDVADPQQIPQEGSDYVFSNFANGDVEIYERKDGTLVMKVLKESTLAHDEHAPQALPVGNYEVKLQKQVTQIGNEPFAVQHVFD